jgi:hypothetical protein
MTHDAKFEWWILAAIGLGLVVILAGGNHWIAGSVLPILLIRAYPQRYVTTPDGLLIRAGLANRLIPYRAITYIGEDMEEPAPLALSAETVKIECGPNCEIWLAPEDPSTFFQDMARHTPHLRRRGQELTKAWV